MRTWMFTAILLLATSSYLQAGVVERDLLAPGDGLLTYDDVNHREWLDLTFTLSTDIAWIKESMATSGILEGFQFATLEDVEKLATSVHVVWRNIPDSTIVIAPGHLPRTPGVEEPVPKPASGPNAKKLLDLLGTILVVSESMTNIQSGTTITISDSITFGQIVPLTAGVTPNFDGTNVSLLGGETLIQSEDSIVLRQSAIFTTSHLTDFPQATGDTGPFWLYREVVPEPSALALLSAAIATAATKRRRANYAVAVWRRP